MKSKLEQLWENFNKYMIVEGDEEECEILEEMYRLEDDVRGGCTPSVCQKFNRYVDRCNDYVEKRESLAFSEGVRFATQFLIEAGYKERKKR
ncbi:MAG: hypothetical protein IKA74_05805 [Clostridia bacterium]|nr:hypothetical protein [Clostridia bacterium]